MNRLAAKTVPEVQLASSEGTFKLQVSTEMIESGQQCVHRNYGNSQQALGCTWKS